MAPDDENKSEYRAPLTTVDLRHNKLKGSIILGNYEVRNIMPTVYKHRVSNSIPLSVRLVVKLSVY